MRYILTILLTPFIFAAEWSATNYNEFGIGIDHVRFDDSSESANTFLLQGKFELSKQFHLVAGASHTNFDAYRVELKSQAGYLGLGVDQTLSQRSSVYARLIINHVDGKIESRNYEVTTNETDLVANLGLRTSITKHFELFTGLSFIDSETSGHLGFEFQIREGWGIQLVATKGDDSNGAALGLVKRF
ncbi:MAG: hypothetical protein OXG15_03220 [Gammaproteobacteria bacterium]|nr:hypothetical protein [Gammaproteobacteria bacterium]